MDHTKHKGSELSAQNQGEDEAIRAAEVRDGTVEVLTAGIHEKVRGVEHDDAADLFDDEEGVFQYTQAEARQVLWKLDLILLPMVGVPSASHSCCFEALAADLPT